MRTHGTLARWNEDRGFGFIAPAQDGDDVFVHVSAFPRDGVRPTVGELISFEIEAGADGKRRAVRVMRPGTQRRPPRTRRGAARQPKRSPLPAVLGLLALIAMATYGYSQFKARTQVPVTAELGAAPRPILGSPPATSSFRCDGRRHCSQMTSCAEATYFIRHCPNTEMDGNGDGVPCEQQWCN